jgi:hypothetical protein
MTAVPNGPFTTPAGPLTTTDTRLPAFRALWSRYGGVMLAVIAAHAFITAVLRLTPAFEALMLRPDAAIDLLIRMDEVRRWFGGIMIYGDAHSANYPPASYTMLWPLVGWLPEAEARALYAVSIVASVISIAAISVRVSGARRLPQIALVALLVMPLGATQITVWIGQLGLHVVVCLLGAAALLLGTRSNAATAASTRAERWSTDLAAAALLTASLVKPTLSVPVAGAILILTCRWRPLLFTAGFYVGLTLAAAAFQEQSATSLIVLWLGRESIMNLPLGSVNTHLWLHWIGVDGSKLLASLLWLTAGSVWTWRYRHVDPWIVIGVAALVARLWIHHRAFDDVILVIPMIVLFRIASSVRGRSAEDARAPAIVPVAGAALLAVNYGLAHAPWHWLSGENRTLWLVAEVGRTVAWVMTLGFLLWHSSHLVRQDQLSSHPTVPAHDPAG